MAPRYAAPVGPCRSEEEARVPSGPETAPRGGEVVRVRLRARGVVQGVGFRPFVHGLAVERGLSGLVGNDADGVFAELEGPAAAVGAALDAVRSDPPPLAVVESVDVEAVPPRGGDGGFTIVESLAGAARRTLVSPDTATCEACLAELFDPRDRRYRYPFLNCTNCGPRYSIVTDVPYDRPNTTMAGFPLCADCAAEYHDPADRRFHAQPTCCPACGPRLRLTPSPEPAEAGGDAAVVAEAAARLVAGEVLAIKGLGGYHLAVLAADEAAVAALRARKHREERPFALMAADLDAAGALGEVGPDAAALLSGPRRPIVLLPRRPDAPVAPSVAPGSRELGVMLPYTPLHHLLAEALPGPFVLTSGNRSDEPIAYRDDEAAERLGPIADGVLSHDRPIHMRIDDAVTRAWRGGELLVRRARGYAPQPVPLAAAAPRHVLACGAELKHTFCLARDRYAFVSPHIGDLENYETLRSFTEGVAHLSRLFDVDPTVVAHDLHPEYLSTKHAVDLEGVALTGVQHHHAHIASCLADAGEAGPVLGVAYDGLGLGTDGTIWGGELLAADLTGFERVGHLASVALPGGQAAIREPWRMAAAWVEVAYDGDPPPLAVAERHAERWGAVTELARRGVQAPATSSVGRLFDAVAALAGVRDVITYEGQAAIELEQAAEPADRGAYPLPLLDGPPLRLDAGALVRAVVDDLAAGASAGEVAARFHDGLAAGTVAACVALRERTGLSTVALSGGVFQNLRLLDAVVDGLGAAGFGVLVHERVPANDGGISLGQAAVAVARDRAGMLG
ncbi:MAG: carbamoyltransferase HypF [Actinomycetota bacterium]